MNIKLFGTGQILLVLILLNSMEIPLVNVTTANELIHDIPLYYSLGGQKAIDSPASVKSSLDILGGANESGNLCGQFQPSLDIQNILSNQLKETLATLNSIPAAVTSALPGYIFCRAQPGLCQLLQHYVVRAENIWNLSIKSCEDLMENLTASGNPFRDLVQTSKFQIWQEHAQSGATATEANRNANQTDGCVAWVNGEKSGCKGQAPIWLTMDTAKAGWCLLQNKEPNCSGVANQPSADANSTLVSTWNSPDEAANWISDVLGDYKIHAGEQPTTMVGTGLLPKVEAETKRLIAALSELVYSASPPTDSALSQLSSDRILLTATLIDALRDLPDRKLLINRIANEVALARVVHQALLARRVLISGVMEPNIQNAGNISESIQKKIDTLEQEINSINFEIQVGRRLVSETVLDVLAAHERFKTPSPSLQSEPEILLK